jgi:RNA 3'-terminal phosphate cyclase (ATP)
VLQTVALPALFAEGTSSFRIRGGSHVPWSPPFDYIADVWCRFLERIGVTLHADLAAFGFYPAGGGEIVARIEGCGRGAGLSLRPVTVIDRGALRSIRGRAIAANLALRIPQRIVDRARALLGGLAPHVEIRPELVRARSAGAGIFLTAEYDHVVCGFSALGARGRSSEQVAEDAVEALLRHQRCGAALDHHLADQILLPLALPRLPSAFTTEAVTSHLETNAWVIEQFGLARMSIQRRDDGTALVSVCPSAGSSIMPTSHAAPF